MDSQRSLAAIVFTDAVGFSGRANVDEDNAFEGIERDFEVMRESCARHDGQVLKSLGDGLLMVFSSAVQAVLCSIDIQDRLQKGGEEDPLLHRIGIHLGDVILSETDAKGDGVNIASRLEQEAPPGGICLSGTIYDVVKSRLTVQVRSRGVTQLKNIVEPIQVYEIGPSAETVDKVSLRKRGGPERQSMATTYAIFFLGICILGAAGIYFISNRRPTPEPLPFPFGPLVDSSTSDTSGRIFQLTPNGVSDKKGDASSESFRAELDKVREEILRALPKDGGRPIDQGRVTVTPPVKPPEKPPVVGDTEPASGAAVNLETPSEKQVAGPQTYDEARKAYAPTYEFEKMTSWVARQPWARKPAGAAVLQHWAHLIEMKAMLYTGIDKLGAMSAENEDIGSDRSSDRLRSLIPKLKPARFRSLAVAVAAKSRQPGRIKAMLKEFDLEYSGGGMSSQVEALQKNTLD